MTTYIFILPWGNYTATAATEKEARKLVNPYLRLYKSAMARAANYERKGITSEAEWYKRMAAINAEDARMFHASAILKRPTSAKR